MIEFSKMQATGNDFVCIKNEDVLKYNLKIFSRYICDRHYGIGADGLILIMKSNIADAKMRIFNKDGTEAEMTGNGIRCLGRYLYEKNIVSKEILKIETISGIKIVENVVQNNKVMEVKVNMGKVILNANKIPIYLPYSNIFRDKGIQKLQFKIKDKEYIGSCISLGNPHTVMLLEDIDNLDVEKVGNIIENYKYFPKKTNVEFVKVISRNQIKVKIWERGVRKNSRMWNWCMCSSNCMLFK